VEGPCHLQRETTGRDVCLGTLGWGLVSNAGPDMAKERSCSLKRKFEPSEKTSKYFLRIFSGEKERTSLI